MQTTTTRSKKRGQGMTEYILIVSLIAIASIGVTTLFGNNIRTLFGLAANALAGDDNLQNSAQHSREEVLRKDMRSAWKNNGAY
jgi:Flp pilus assembly pilin Flp